MNIKLKTKILPSFTLGAILDVASEQSSLGQPQGTEGPPYTRINFQEREDGCDNFSGSLGWVETSLFNGLEHAGDTGGLRREGTLEDFSQENA